MNSQKNLYENKEGYTYETALKKFLEVCKKNEYPESEIKEFLRIIDYSKKILKNEKRIAGYASIVHNIRIATWIARSKLGIRTLKCGLLYETCRHVSDEDIEKNFGREISQMMKDTKKISEYTKKKKKESHENLNEMLISSLKDVRVLIVKMAAKLENLIAIDVLPKEKQLKVAKDVLDFYAPLALRIGTEKIRREFEDKAFQIINPKKYNEIVKYLQNTKEERESFLKELVSDVEKYFKKNKQKIIFIRSRVKHIYSIYNKFKREINEIENGKKKLVEQSDHYGIRIICKDVEDCFKVASLLKKKYKTIEIKDYITQKKPNNYQSIHMIFEIEDKKVEFQIRTEDMDYIAEYGSASHNAYKHSQPINQLDAKINWLREMFEIQADSRASQTLRKISFEMFNENIFCFTPHNDIIKLPRDSVVLDFAFSLHKDLGLKCIGGIVNNSFECPIFKLKTGDVVEIVEHTKQIPSPDWLNYCKTKKAKNEIKKYLISEKKMKFVENKKETLIEEETKLVIVENSKLKSPKIKLASCCMPLPLNRISGLEKKDSIYVHKNTCEKIIKQKNKVKCSWSTKDFEDIHLIINAIDRAGIISDLMNSIKNDNDLISNIKGEVLSKTNARCIFIMKKTNLGKISGLIEKLNKVKGVTSIRVKTN
jgi:GTP diphosphokinase / guanosine-3',5'-bis(diphosphate) 3'-diphosphatase